MSGVDLHATISVGVVLDTSSMNRIAPIAAGILGLSLLAACGGGGGGSSLPDECKTNSPLQITSPGLDALTGEFTPTDTLIVPGKIVPGVDMFGKTPEELTALEADSIGTAYRAIVADFPIKENQIAGGFNSGVFEPETGGTHLYFSLFPNEGGTWTAGDVLSVTSPSPYLAEVASSGNANVSLYLGTTLADSYLLGGVTSDYSGSATVLAADDKNLCISIDYTIPVLGSDTTEKFNVTGVISGKIEEYVPGDLAS